MNNSRKSVTEKMKRLKKKYPDTSNISVHRTLLKRAYSLLISCRPESEKIFGSVMDIMDNTVCRPDKKGDRENGLGKHYYCAVSPLGKRQSTTHGWYKNGIGSFSQSARSMLEEDFTMALTMYSSGFTVQAADYLARAVHMLSDICCLPHVCGMTYFSPYRNIHKEYEALAKAMYPNAVPKQTVTDDKLRLFESRTSFSRALNSIVETVFDEIPLLYNAPEKEISLRLYHTEIAVASLLLRFFEDLSLPPAKAHFLTDGMKCAFIGDKQPHTVKITENGAALKINGHSGIFQAAHRHSGFFTLSPVGVKNGKVIERGKKSPQSYDPTNQNQFFYIY